MSVGFRSVIGLAAIIGLAGMIGEAAAQYYPPDYPPPPRPYRSMPLPPLEPDEEPPPGAYRGSERPGPYGHVIEPRDGRRPIYDPGLDRQALPRDPYGPARRPFFAPDDDATRFGTSRREEGAIVRPPSDIGRGSGPDTTGTVRAPADPRRGARYAALPPEDQPEEGPVKELPQHLKRQLVDYATKEPAGTLVIDTQNTYLYLVLGKGKALRYGIGVGREGFTWSGKERVSKVAEWPDWHPPKEMIERQPYLPRMMAGGPGNPLGARALYLGKTIYRIHGTNQPSTIGQFVSSGCIRMLNEDVEDLYGRVQVGTRVVVLPGNPPATANAPLAITR
jgi:lipoprotein-anchoring transpeptidase ErfK/SrfK